MEIVCQAWYPQAETLIEAIPILANQGVTAIEISVNNSLYFDYRNAFELNKVLARLQSYGIRVPSIHSPFGQEYDISSLHDEVHEHGVDAIIESIELANIIGAGKVIIHASDIVSSNRRKRFERAHGVLRELSTLASESGLILAVENLPPNYLGNEPEELFELIDGIDKKSIGFCFDVGHANLSGNFCEFAEKLLPYSVETHIHDNNGKVDQHKFPGEGTINWKEFSEVYKASKSNATIMLECVPPSEMLWSEAFQYFRITMED